MRKSYGAYQEGYARTILLLKSKTNDHESNEFAMGDLRLDIFIQPEENGNLAAGTAEPADIES